MVLIHGAANDHSVWASLLGQSVEKRHFSSTNLLTVDLPGHGQTFAEAKSSITEYADWLINFLDNGAIKAATLVGHSMGSLIALDVARRYPDRVARLGLISTALPMPVSDAVQQLVQSDPLAACDQLTRWNFYLRKTRMAVFRRPPLGRRKTAQCSRVHDQECWPMTSTRALRMHPMLHLSLQSTHQCWWW